MTPEEAHDICRAHPEGTGDLFGGTKDLPAIRGSLAKDGVWWIRPAVRPGSSRIVGWRVRPPGAEHTPPVDSFDPPIGAAVATDWGFLVPSLFYRNYLFSCDEAWAEMREVWSELRPNLEPLHLALGGSPRELEALADILFDDEMLRLHGLERGEAERSAAHRAIAVRLDPELLPFVRFLEQACADPFVSVPDLGRWTPAAQAHSWRLRDEADANRPETIAAMCRWLCGNLVLDANPTNLGVPQEEAQGPLNRLTAYGVAEAVCQQPEHADLPADDPWWHAIRGMAEPNYAGVEHVRTAALLDEADRPEEAWDALIAAAAWTQRVTGRVLPTFREAALDMARRRGWSDIVTQMEATADPRGAE